MAGVDVLKLRLGRVVGLGVVGLLVATGALVGCGKKDPRMNEFLDAQERYDLGRQLIAEGELSPAIKVLSRVDSYDSPNRKEIEPLLRLALADATFYKGSSLAWIDARSLYQDFVTLYGDHDLAPYAQLQTGICVLLQIVHPSRDQSETFQAIADFRQVETRWPSSLYAGAARTMRIKAESNLAEHDLLVGRFYEKRGAHIAASGRFRRALTEYPNYYDLETVYFLLGQSLLPGNTEEGKIYLSKVLADFPSSRYAGQIRKMLSDASERKSRTPDAAAAP
ncbi:MAG: outer membrane protein assembly factor BamD [Acidobacteriota bacterium]|nr:outer membrane protein assembly factor BamD [Acidobacteriota bacterium]